MFRIGRKLVPRFPLLRYEQGCEGRPSRGLCPLEKEVLCPSFVSCSSSRLTVARDRTSTSWHGHVYRVYLDLGDCLVFLPTVLSHNKLDAAHFLVFTVTKLSLSCVPQLFLFSC
ncbi:hypothetical protein TSMEX_011828 [Taenia solium]|eukprot:TsM_000369400 transcript=TsM_000369400 gene=TsM_000369400